MAIILMIGEELGRLNTFHASVQSIFKEVILLTAANFDSAVKLDPGYDPDVILAGYPDKTEQNSLLCKNLKRNERFKSTPILLVIPEKTNKTIQKQALEAGADAFITYPADEFELKIQLTNLFKIKMANRITGSDSTFRAVKNQTSGKDVKSSFSSPENDLFFRNMMTHIPQRVFVKDFNSTYIVCNESFASDLGITRETIQGKTDFDFYPKELADLYRKDDHFVITSATVKDIQEPYFLNGEERWAHTIKVPFRDRNGKIVGVMGILEDVTEHRRMEKQLFESEKKYRTIYENVQDVFYEMTLDGIITEISPSIGILSRGYYAPHELIGKSVLNFYADPKSGDGFLGTLIKKKSVSDYEISFKNRDNQSIPCSLSAKMQFDNQGLPQKITGTIRDIAKRKQMESDLQFSNELLSRIFSLIPVPISVNNLSDQSRFVDCNKAFYKATGFSEEDVIGKSALEIGLYVQPNEQEAAMKQLAEKGKISAFEHHYLKNKNEIGIGLLSLETFSLEEKNYAITVNLDITEQKKAEKDLIEAKERALESENRMRAILDNSLDAISLTKDGTNIFANQAYLDLFGYKNLDEFLHSSLLEDIAPSARGGVLENIKNRAAGGNAPAFYESAGIRRNGEEFPFEVRVGTWNEGHAQYSVGIIRDITARKKNQEKLDKVNRLYTVISQINKAIVRLKNKDTLLEEVCRIAIDAGKFRMAWIGFIDEETKLIKPFAVAGHEDGYLSVIKPISVRDIPEGRGPTGTALRKGKHSVCNDYANDVHVAIWREKALKRGYRSSVSLPVKEMGEISGAFTIYASTPDFFDQEEIDLLNEVASDISFALDTIKLEKEHQEALAALIESEDKYRKLTENMKDVIWVLDTDTLKFKYVSPSVEKLRGFTPEEIMAEPMDAALTPVQAEELKGILAQKKALFLDGKLPGEYFYYTEEIMQPCKDGSFIQTEVVTTLYLNQLTGKVELHGVTRDITERRRAEEKLRESEQRYRLLFDNSFDALALTSSDGIVLSANPAMCKMFGRTEEEIQQAGREEIVDVTDPRLPIALRERAKTGHFFGEITGIRKDGTKFPIEVSSTLFTTQEGMVQSSMIIRDLTTRKKEEEQRRILLRAVEQSPVSIVITDTEGQIQYINPKFCETTGYSREEAIGKNPSILKSGDHSKEEYQKMWDTILSGKEWHGEFRNLKKNGETYFENALISPVTDVSGKIIQFVAVKEDITERKKTELLVRTLSAAVEQSPTMIVITDSEGKIEFTNQQFSEFLQYSASEVFGKLPRLFRSGHQAPNLSEKMWQTLKNGDVWKTEHQNRKKDGTKFWEQVTVFPLTSEAGKVTNYIITQDDISEKKQLLDELVNAKNKAEESDHLKSAFLANMSHEIRTPLNSIIGFSELLLDPDFNQKQQSDFVYMIKQSGVNLLSIINNIMDISKLESRQVTIRKQKFSLNGLIRDIKKENSRLADEKNIDFKVNIPEENIWIVNDEPKIKQVLVNYVNNALKFTPKGFVEIGFGIHQNLANIYVKDSGIGIPHEFHGKIFERFRQVETALTRHYGGSGLGLAISKQLAELIGGKVSLESEPQKGSTFYLSLPVES